MSPPDQRVPDDAGDPLVGFEGASPSPDLRRRVIALDARSALPQRRAWWPAAAAAVLLAATVLANRALDARLARVAGPSAASAGRLQPYAPHAPLPISTTSWAVLRRSEVML